MRHKWIAVLMVLFLAALFAVLYLNNESNKQVGSDVTPETELKSQSKIKSSDNEQAKNQEEIEPLDISPKDEINDIPISEYLAEIKNPVYSDDPVLEFTSLGVDFRVCDHPLGMLTKKAEKKPELKAFKNQLKEKCEAYADQYPLLFKYRNGHEETLSLPTNSLLGEQFKHVLAGYYGKHNDLSYDQLQETQFELSLQLKNPNLISFGGSAIGIGLSAPLERTAFFMDLLKSHVNLWVFEAHNLTVQLMTCDLPNSQTCEATSFYMLYRCQNESAACGLTLQQWYDSHTTSGMKKDVEIILQYYRDNY